MSICLLAASASRPTRASPSTTRPPDHPLQHQFRKYAFGIHMNGDLSQGGDGIISGALVERNTIYDNGVGGGSAINEAPPCT